MMCKAVIRGRPTHNNPPPPNISPPHSPHTNPEPCASFRLQGPGAAKGPPLTVATPHPKPPPTTPPPPPGAPPPPPPVHYPPDALTSRPFN